MRASEREKGNERNKAEERTQNACRQTATLRGGHFLFDGNWIKRQVSWFSMSNSYKRWMSANKMTLFTHWILVFLFLFSIGSTSSSAMISSFYKQLQDHFGKQPELIDKRFISQTFHSNFPFSHWQWIVTLVFAERGNERASSLFVTSSLFHWLWQLFSIRFVIVLPLFLLMKQKHCFASRPVFVFTSFLTKRKMPFYFIRIFFRFGFAFLSIWSFFAHT